MLSDPYSARDRLTESRLKETLLAPQLLSDLVIGIQTNKVGIASNYGSCLLDRSSSVGFIGRACVYPLR
jgi:hypothetical protein